MKRNAFVRVLPACTIIAAAILPFTAWSQNLPFPPPQKEICTDQNIVDKEKLTDYLLQKFPINARALPPTSDPHLLSLSLQRQLMVGPQLADPENCSRCSKSDKENLRAIRGHMSQVLAGSLKSSYAPTADIDPEIYFAGSNATNQIACVVANGKPVEAPDAFFQPPQASASKFRVRGSATDLYVDRSSQQNFAAASKATINFVDDDVAKKRTDKMTATIGYSFTTSPFADMPWTHLELIPYVGTNRTIVKVGSGSSSKPSATETANFGFLSSLYYAEESGILPFSHILNVRPDFLLDLQDDSRLFTLNFQYVPVINKFLNSYRPLPGAADFASFKVIFDIRNDNGIYTDRGETGVRDQHKNFLRIGGQLGLAVVSDNIDVPMSFTTTYTGLYGAVGEKDIGYFANSLTYYLDPNKYFGIGINFTNGTREDTAKRENQWEVAFSGRF